MIDLEHYCGCTPARPCAGGEWCCGGDDTCDAVEREPDCVDGLSHAWTREGCGGCAENPGVQSLGGTKFRFQSRCVYCGVRRTETAMGVQRNPGQCDTVSYSPGDPEPGAAEEALRHRRRAALARRRRQERDPAWCAAIAAGADPVRAVAAARRERRRAVWARTLGAAIATAGGRT